MAVEAKRSSTPLDDSALNNTAFSMDSLQIGDSTRSLLSPLYDKGEESDNERSYRSKSEKDSASSNSSGKSEENYSSDYEESERSTVKKGKAKRSKSSQSSSSSTSSSSSCSYSTPKSKKKQTIKNPTPKQTDNNNSEVHTEQEPCLSPWEKWLLAKVLQDEKRDKANRRKEQIKEEIIQNKAREMTEKEKRAEDNRKEWLKLKRNETKIQNELVVRLEQEKLHKEEEEQVRIQAKAEESFGKWFETKEHERKEQMKNQNMNKKVKKETKLQRKQQSEDAYNKWLENAKHQPKSKNNHFGVLGGKVTGYYDWTCYPMPSYNNPKPWVSPKIKTRCESKVKLQDPSPPLMFKEIEEREKKARMMTRNNVKTKQSRNSVC